MTIRTATVTGLERFIGDMNRCNRPPGSVTDDPERHHAAYHQSNGGTLVLGGLCSQGEWLVLHDQLDADPRTLFCHLLALTDGRISYRVYQ